MSALEIMTGRDSETNRRHGRAARGRGVGKKLAPDQRGRSGGGLRSERKSTGCNHSISSLLTASRLGAAGRARPGQLGPPFALSSTAQHVKNVALCPRPPESSRVHAPAPAEKPAGNAVATRAACGSALELEAWAALRCRNAANVTFARRPGRRARCRRDWRCKKTHEFLIPRCSANQTNKKLTE